MIVDYEYILLQHQYVYTTPVIGVGCLE